VNQHARTVVIAVICFGLGAVAQRAYDTRGTVAPVVAEAPPVPAIDLPTALGPTVDVSTINFEQQPLWAYGVDRAPQPGEKAAPQAPPNRELRPKQDPEEQTRPRTVEGSKASYSLVDVRDGQNVIDWFPEDHPPMPEVIKHGPARLKETKRGCGSCHLPTGLGRPENAPVAGLPVAYFVRQIQDFRAGLRRTADPRKPNTNTMIDLAKAMTDEEVQIAAEYFAAVPWIPWTRVVESDRVPRTRILGNLFLPLAEEKTEPIAGRIVEMPENEEQTELLRSPRTGFVAYVPPGSLKRGKELVTTGGMRIVNGQIVQGKTVACGTCHGQDLMGVADVPPIAGRSPSYLTRQIWDIQQGTRNGSSAQLMKLVVASLTQDDLVDIAAYVSSLKPGSPTPVTTN
jgi:cytochrome c553